METQRDADFKTEITNVLTVIKRRMAFVLFILATPFILLLAQLSVTMFMGDFTYQTISPLIIGILFIIYTYITQWLLHIRLSEKKIDLDFLQMRMIQNKKKQLTEKMRRHNIDTAPVEFVAQEAISYTNLFYRFFIIDVLIVIAVIGICSLIALFFISYNAFTPIIIAVGYIVSYYLFIRSRI